MLMRLNCVCVCVCVCARMFLYVAVEMVCSESWENRVTEVLPVFITEVYLMFSFKLCPSFCFIPSLKPCDSGFNKQRQVQRLSVKSYSFFLF